MSKKLISCITNTIIGVIIFSIFGIIHGLIIFTNNLDAVNQYYNGSIIKAATSVLWDGYFGIPIFLIYYSYGIFAIFIMPAFYGLGFVTVKLFHFLFRKKDPVSS